MVDSYRATEIPRGEGEEGGEGWLSPAGKQLADEEGGGAKGSRVIIEPIKCSNSHK